MQDIPPEAGVPQEFLKILDTRERGEPLQTQPVTETEEISYDEAEKKMDAATQALVAEFTNLQNSYQQTDAEIFRTRRDIYEGFDHARQEFRTAQAEYIGPWLSTHNETIAQGLAAIAREPDHPLAQAVTTLDDFFRTQLVVEGQFHFDNLKLILDILVPHCRTFQADSASERLLHETIDLAEKAGYGSVEIHIDEQGNRDDRHDFPYSFIPHVDTYPFALTEPEIGANRRTRDILDELTAGFF